MKLTWMVSPLLSAALVLGACGDTGTTTKETVPTPEQLASVLVAAPQLGEGWTVLTPPEGEGPQPGVIAPEDRAHLPQMKFCPAAPPAAQQAAANLAWQAYEQLNLATDRSHLVFVQEFLTADTKASAIAALDHVALGVKACYGPAGGSEEASDVLEPWDPPVVGDAVVGYRELVQEGQGTPSATWDLHYALVRDGGVLMAAMVAEIVRGDAAPLLDEAEVARIVTVLAGRLGELD